MNESPIISVAIQSFVVILILGGAVLVARAFARRR
jgi:hypothetical protein